MSVTDYTPLGTTVEPNCGSYTFKNRTRYDPTNGTYEGIPFNLIINACAFVFLIFLFAVLRKLAWDYGRIALVSRTEENSRWTSLFYGDHDNRNQQMGSVESLDTHLHTQDKNICSWIPAFIRVKDTHILQKSGQDAIQYLSFQRYLIIYTVIITVLSVAVIVPVNFSGNNIGNATDFGHTTIGNLDPESSLLWIHSILAVAFLVLLVALMRHFKLNLEFQEDEQVSRTLMISNIPTRSCYKSIIMQHFQEAYTEVVVTDVQFAYNIAKLVALDKTRKVAEEARKNSEIEYDKTGVRPTMRPMFCGQLCCCCGVKEVDAIMHYAQLEKDLTEQCEQEKVTAYQDPLGIAFVTFQNDMMAGRVRMDFRTSCKGVNNPQNSSIHMDLDISNWQVRYAPSPENIYWENLSKSSWKWWLQAIIINSFVIILLFFFTTPLIIMNNLNEINYLKPIEEHSPLLVDFLPTLLLWTFTALLPNIVYWSDQLIGHWTRTAEHHAIMVKTFIFLLLMVLILPSLGLTSAKALFQWFVLDQEGSFRWKCIFVANHGAFFVNYITTAAFIGSALELMRFSELFMYGLRLSLAHSSAEKTAIRKALVWEFQYGIQYAWMLCVFAVIMAYSLLCPLVAPFGLVYICLKHVVDRYNIYFAYKPSRISKGIHKTAINFVTIAVILLQFNIVFFTALRSETVNPVFVFSSAMLFITLVLFVGRVGFGWFKNLSYLRVKYRRKMENEHRSGDYDKPFGEEDGTTAASDSTSTAFVPSVLQDKQQENGRDVPKPAGSYGTMENTASVNTDYDTQPDQQYQ